MMALSSVSPANLPPTFSPSHNNLSRHPLSLSILTHLNAGRLREAVSTLTRSGPHHHPDLITYSLLLKSCIRSRNFRLGKLVHQNLSLSGLEPDPVILNSLISLYSKCGEWESAYGVFRSMGSRRDLVSWSALISCFAMNGMELEAIEAFVDMLGEGVWANEYCYSGVIRACSNREFFWMGEVVFGLVLKSGHLGSHVCVGCALIDMFVRGRGDVDGAWRVFDEMPERNVVSWTLMITRFQQLGYWEDAFLGFRDMISSGFVPDGFTLSGVVSACAELGWLWLGRQLHCWVVKLGLESDVCVGCSLIDMYAKCVQYRSMDDSRTVFDRISDNNVMSWTAIISGYVQRGFDREGIELFREMIEGRVRPNHFTLSSVIKACAGVLDLNLGEQIYAYAFKLGLASVNCVGNSIISMYAHCGDVENARKAFDALFEKNLVSYNTIVDAYARSSNFEKAFKIFHEIEDVEIGVDAFTFASLLSGASTIGSISKGEQIHARVLKSGLISNLHICNSLISMYSRCGDIEAASQVFEELEDHNVISWTAMVTGFAKHGFAARALETFEKMLQADVRPNEVTYVAVLTACSHVGLVSEGMRHFEAMNREHGIVPRMEHYACIVDLLGRSGCLVEAMEFINSMPFKADVLVLRTFLGSCQVHGNIDLGKVAAKMILEQEPDDPAAYVLLSNLYASAGQWEDVAEVRKGMKQRNLTKQAGCSWIEAENGVHRFYVGDSMHPQSQEIYQELDRLAIEIKELGYIPNTDFVLHDVEEEQKEQYLFHHSEKIAVAYGLISTSKSKPIRVFKNLRICGDCHMAIKYFSLARKREIVVRDSNRFHHFKDGKCSCNDYW